MKMDALKHQGQACGQVGHKSRDTLSETESGRQIQRYIRLTNLIPGILEKVDREEIALTPAVELSYLDHDAQKIVLDAMQQEDMGQPGKTVVLFSQTSWDIIYLLPPSTNLSSALWRRSEALKPGSMIFVTLTQLLLFVPVMISKQFKII